MALPFFLEHLWSPETESRVQRLWPPHAWLQQAELRLTEHCLRGLASVSPSAQSTEPDIGPHTVASEGGAAPGHWKGG